MGGSPRGGHHLTFLDVKKLLRLTGLEEETLGDSALPASAKP